MVRTSREIQSIFVGQKKKTGATRLRGTKRLTIYTFQSSKVEEACLKGREVKSPMEKGRVD